MWTPESCYWQAGLPSPGRVLAGLILGRVMPMWELAARVLVLAGCFCVLGLVSSGSPPAQCELVSGLKTLHDLIPEVVGDCLEGPHVDGPLGDIQQRTTGGLLVWRRGDNVPTFTDGSTTWLLGPNGLESRPNGIRLEWEAPTDGCVLPRPTVYEGRTLNFLSTCGSLIVDAWGRPVLLSGVNWSGMEGATMAPHGLWARRWEELLDLVVAMGFNTLRLPFSSELLVSSHQPTGIDPALNPDLVGLTGLELLDRLIVGAGQRGLKVILDRHRIAARSPPMLWYSDEADEERWIAGWVALARRYRYNDTVIGADLHNEPGPAATWGSGDRRTDWSLAAERAARAIHEVNPDWLIFVQGIERAEEGPDTRPIWYWRGGLLSTARSYPVRLSVPNKLVYSPHEYGPAVFPQPWFFVSQFPGNLPDIWDAVWGYLSKEGTAPVLLGEIGAGSLEDPRERLWFETIMTYLRENQIHYTYWTLNGDDALGLLEEDWQTIRRGKLSVLATHQGTLLGSSNPEYVDLEAVPGG